MKIPDLIFMSVMTGSVFVLFTSVLMLTAHNTGSKTLNARKLRNLEKQLPTFLDSISSGLSVGNSLLQSMETYTRGDRSTLGDIIVKILNRVNSGMTLEDSLECEAGDLPGGSLALAFLTMASSYRSGSNMIESLSLIAYVCRERENLRRKILARTAQSRLQGYVLIFVPIMFMASLYAVSPSNMIPVLATSTGRLMLGTALVLQCLGGLCIWAILKQEIL